MSFTEYLTKFLIQVLDDRPTLGLSHLDVLASLVAAAEMVCSDWRHDKQINAEFNLTAEQKALIAAALRIDNPIARNTLLLHERNNFGRLERPRLPA